MKQISQGFRGFLLLSIILCFTSMNAQVGIGTTSPNANALLDIDATSTIGGLLLPRLNLTSTSSFAPLSAHVAGMTVYNLATVNDVTPGVYINDGGQWVSVGATTPTAEPAIDAVSLTVDTVLNGITYTDIPGMSLTFTARKTSVLVQLTASGFGSINSMSVAFLRIFNTTSSTVVGGTMEKVQTFYDPAGPSEFWITTWSSAYSKQLTGLTVGNTYSIKVQGYAQPVSIGGTAVIQPITNPNSNHLTLSVHQ